MRACVRVCVCVRERERQRERERERDPLLPASHVSVCAEFFEYMALTSYACARVVV